MIEQIHGQKDSEFNEIYQEAASDAKVLGILMHRESEWEPWDGAITRLCTSKIIPEPPARLRLCSSARTIRASAGEGEMNNPPVKKGASSV